MTVIAVRDGIMASDSLVTGNRIKLRHGNYTGTMPILSAFREAKTIAWP